MLGSTLLDVVIGVTFIYLFLSLIGSAITEFIANFRQLRAKNLEQWVRSILDGPKSKELGDKFYEHPLIRGLMQDGRRPSYIPSRTFALALMDVIASEDDVKSSKLLVGVRESLEKIEYEPFKNVLLHQLEDAGAEINTIRQNLEKWFDDGMERVSGWYKRKSQLIILLISITITLVLNVDTISLATRLYHDAPLRSGLVAAADEIAKKQLGQDASAQAKEIKADLDKMQFPIGWPIFEGAGSDTVNEQDIPHSFLGWMTKLAGWVITAFAISLGAPFWFDVLGKFINIRSTGVKPKPAGETDTKDASGKLTVPTTG